MGRASSSAIAVKPPTSDARRYMLLRRLAVGGMGELFLARASAPGGVQKLVAIKRVRPEYASDETFVTMFLNEARLAATLDHPNIVRTYDLVEDGGSYFMVMEYLHGESLGHVLNTAARAQQRVPLEHIVTIVLGVAAGLHCAHERRGVDGRPLDIVHRDLSPGNVVLTYEGGVKLLDFGIAKATSRTSVTIGPTRKGKVSYMSPEQCVGDDVDRRSDIFALGVVMWELCTGRRLFRGDNEFAIMNQITTTDAPAATSVVSDLPPALAGIIAKALSRDREDRFQTAMQLHDAVEAFAAEHGLLPSMPALGRYLEQTCGRREFPSAEPTEEFVHKRETVVARGPAKPLPRRRWSLVAALGTGITLGAVAVGIASSGTSAPAPEPSSRAASTPAAMNEPATRDAAASEDEKKADEPASAPDELPADASASARPKAEPVAPAAPAPSASSEPRRSRGHQTKRRNRKKASRRPSKTDTTKPDTPVRGVDGLLPRG